MLDTVVIMHILQKGFLVLSSIRCCVLRMNIHYHVQLPKWLQCPESIEDMLCNEKHTHRRSLISIIFRHLLTGKLHGEKQVCHPLSLLLSHSSHNAIHMIENVIVYCDNLMQCHCMPLCHPQGPISDWLQYFDDILDNHLFALYCEEWPDIIGLWIVEPLAGEFL